MSRRNARKYLIFNNRPKCVKPGSIAAGLRQAIVTYLSYNQERVELPGIWKSPFGNYDVRLARTFTLIMLLTLVVGHVMFRPLRVDGELFSTLTPIGFFVVPTISLGIWLIAVGFPCFLTARDAHGLQLARFSPEFWPEFVEDRKNSSDPIEKDSVFLGTVNYDGSPILHPIEQLMKHAWIVGKTGSGKTTYLLALIDQLVRRGDTSLVYLDLKATSFEPLATMQQRPTKYFTLEHGEASYALDLFSQQAWHDMPTAQRAALVLCALSLIYTPGYGRSWYRDAAYDVVFFVLDRHPDIKGWGEFAKRIQDAMRHAKPWELSEQVKHDGVHVQLIIKRLAALTALNVDETTPDRNKRERN